MDFFERTKLANGWYDPFYLPKRATYSLKDNFNGKTRELEVVTYSGHNDNPYTATARTDTKGDKRFLVAITGLASIGGKVKEVKFEVSRNGFFESNADGFYIQMWVPHGDSVRVHTVTGVSEQGMNVPVKELVHHGFEEAFGLPIVGQYNSGH
jgi:hypothetical protein